MATHEAKYVILGGGMVAGYAAKQLVELGLGKGELAIVSSDAYVPYERPPLSKGFLAGRDSEESTRINPEKFYSEHHIDLRLKVMVKAVDPIRKLLHLENGDDYRFEKLVIASGANPRHLEIPGAELKNVMYLRALDDSKAIRERAEGVKKAVVIGGGFIGMEVASVLAQKSIDVTMILPEDRISKKLFTPEVSQFFESYYQKRGVKLVKKATVKELRGSKTVDAVAQEGGQTIPAELVVAGIGVTPAVEFLADSGINVGDGVTVNEFLETNTPDIYAAGDVANYQDVLFNKRRRVEHWDNAVSQGQHVAKVLTGHREPFKHVPYFFSDVFELSYEYWGEGADADEAIHRGDLSTNSFSVWWLKKGVVVAAFVMNR